MGGGGHVGCMGERRDACRILMWRPEGRSPLIRSWRGLENNIKMYLQEVGWGTHGLVYSGSG
jgi:hypothetical protein